MHRRVGALAAILLAGCLGPTSTPNLEDAATGAAAVLQCPAGSAADACNQGLSGPGVNEFSAAVNPEDPNNAIVTANDYGAQENPALARFHRLWGSWWVTKDAGRTWDYHTLSGMLPAVDGPFLGAQFVGDLVVTFAPDGTALIAGIAYGPQGLRNALFIAKSTDGGATFPRPVLVDMAEPVDAAFRDKPALAIDSTGRMFIVWNYQDRTGQQSAPDEYQMRLAISEDGGATWTTKRLSPDQTGISASIAIGPDDSVNVAWRSYEPNAILFVRSEDHGTSFSKPLVLRDVSELALTLPKTTYRAFILPTLVARPDGGLLLVTADKGPGGDSDVFLLQSSDEGATWTDRRLNTDATKNAQFLPTLAAGEDGRLVAAWLDRRDDPADATYRLYAASSPDGETFTEFRIAATASADPNAQDPLRGTPAGSALFIGDYIGAAVGGDRVYLAWPDLREDGKSKLFSAALVLA